MNDRQYLKVATVAAFLIAFTTVGVHFITFTVDTWEQRAQLSNSSLYHFRNGLLVFHCILAIVSLYGVVVVKRNSRFASVSIGMLFFTLFSFTEILRMMFNSWYANGLRRRYLDATDESLRFLLEVDLENWGLVSNSFFLVFVLCFAIGNLFYGLALYNDSEIFSRILGFGFLLWSLFSFIAFGNDFWGNEILGSIVEINNKYYQPLIRFAIGVWLWKNRSMNGQQLKFAPVQNSALNH